MTVCRFSNRNEDLSIVTAHPLEQDFMLSFAN